MAGEWWMREEDGEMEGAEGEGGREAGREGVGGRNSLGLDRTAYCDTIRLGLFEYWHPYADRVIGRLVAVWQA